MFNSPTRLGSVSEFFVPIDVTAMALTRYMDELVDEQVRELAAMYARLVEDLEGRVREIKLVTRDGWLARKRPAAIAGEPCAIRRRLEKLPACPPENRAQDELPEFRSEPRRRGVYLRLTSGCYRNADLRAYDRRGRLVAREFVIDDPIFRLGAVRFLWSVLESRDPRSRPAWRRR